MFDESRSNILWNRKSFSKFQTDLRKGIYKERVVCILILLFIILAAAAVMDVCFDKIYNEWICLALMAGLSHALWKGGTSGLVWALVSMTVPVFLLYPLFMIGCLGAGDIKLMASVGCFLTVKDTVICMGISFFIGAVFSLLKMMAERNFLLRMRYLFTYMQEVAGSGEWKLYEEDSGEDGENRKKEKIHFALPVMIGVILYKGGLTR